MGDKRIKFIEIKITNHDVLLEKVNSSFMVLFFCFDIHDTNASLHIQLYRQKCKLFQPTQVSFYSLFGNTMLLSVSLRDVTLRYVKLFVSVGSNMTPIDAQ